MTARVAEHPAAPAHYRFKSAAGEHLLVVAHSRIFDIDAPAEILAGPSLDLDSLAAALSGTLDGEDDLDIVPAARPQNISLNVSNACNLSCSYCFASRGSFAGAQQSMMDWPTAKASVDRLLACADAGRPITIGFMGGEPFVNRAVIHETVRYAASRAKDSRLDVRFSVTTNGTLLTEDDIDLIRSHPFAVTVSIDGGAAVHNKLRPSAGRRPDKSFDDVVAAIQPLLRRPGATKIAARATVSRRMLDLQALMTDILSLGFQEVGFSPLRRSPVSTGDEFTDEDWPRYLDALVQLAHAELLHASQGKPMRLTNLAVALKQLQRGAASPYPCGAGGGYLSVSAAGDWYACHRAIGEPQYFIGGRESGPAPDRMQNFLAQHHVHAQQDCRTCWARYLCSGGCHQEAGARSQASCDFIRAWLTFCLQALCERSGNDVPRV